ncbi:MAG: PAS domain S-box protein, partial [Acidobacteriia bacterium]|nr:PAS domain S-box protein [Terriglobia bacterium]
FVLASFGLALISDSERRAVARATRSKYAEREQKQRFETTLASIGDAVIATDEVGRVTFANKVALSLTGWSEEEMVGQDLAEVFRIVNEFTRATVQNPVEKVLREGAVVGLANHTVLITRSGEEIPIDDSAAPIRDGAGAVQGTVLVFRDITARRQAERTRQVLSWIVESSDDAIIGKNLDGVVTSWNRGAERMFDYSAEEMIGKPISLLEVPGHPDEMTAILKRIAEGERVNHFETLRRTKAGKLIHASVSVSPVLDSDGRVIGASKIVRDMTPEVRAKEEIAEQRERLRVTLNSIGDAVMTTDISGRVSYLNPVAEQLTGWGLEEAVSRPLEEVFRIVNEKSGLKVENPVTRVIREGQIAGLANHTVLISRDGKETAIDDSAAPIRNARGEIIGVVLIFRDITERRQAEERFRLAVEAAPNGMIVTDEEGKMILVNSEMERLFGYSHEEMIGQPVEFLAPLRLGDSHVQYRKSFYANPEARLMGEGRDLRGRRKDGSEFPVEIALNPIETSRGRWVLSAVVDITERKRMEQERLEMVAKESTLASERALRETEAELARVARGLTLGELASSIAHEVNQPLTGVVTNAEAGLRWLGSEPPNLPEVRESLALIARDANRASAVIQRIRGFLKKGNQEITSFDINEAFQEVLALAESHLIRSGVEVRTQFATGLPRVLGDRIGVQQVFLNLIMNSRDAMITVNDRPRDLVVTSQESNGGGILVKIQDSGVGIRPEDTTRIFEAFFTTKTNGMGLGLSISRSIIEAHGGRIWAEAGDGPGLTVQFSLPTDTENEARTVSRSLS